VQGEASAEETVEPRAGEILVRPAPAAAPTLQELFLAWLDEVQARHGKVKVHNQEGKITKVSIDRRALEPNLAAPASLRSWERRGWLKVRPREFGIVGRGLVVIGPERLEAFKKLHHEPLGAEKSGEADGTETLSAGADGERSAGGDIDLAPLRRWLEGNGYLLEGHPNRGVFEGEKNAPAAIGVYQERAVWLPQEVLQGILGAVPGGLKKQQKQMKSTQSRRRLVGVEHPLLNRLEPLLGWLTTNAHLLEGHPCRDLLGAAQQEDVLAIGVFEERCVALSRETMEEILGTLPDAARERRWGARRLYEITIGV
jgi:hypothetical protein